MNRERHAYVIATDSVGRGRIVTPDSTSSVEFTPLSSGGYDNV